MFIGAKVGGGGEGVDLGLDYSLSISRGSIDFSHDAGETVHLIAVCYLVFQKNFLGHGQYFFCGGVGQGDHNTKTNVQRRY